MTASLRPVTRWSPDEEVTCTCVLVTSHREVSGAVREAEEQEQAGALGGDAVSRKESTAGHSGQGNKQQECR